MELPHLGEHCTENTCKRLGTFSCLCLVSVCDLNFDSIIKKNVSHVDFLPMKCDACEDIFCKDHITYANHKCTSAYMKVFNIYIYLFICMCVFLNI